jgi:hypothetical protein
MVVAKSFCLFDFSFFCPIFSELVVLGLCHLGAPSNTDAHFVACTKNYIKHSHDFLSEDASIIFGKV